MNPFTKSYNKLKGWIYDWLTYEPPSQSFLPYDFNRLKYEIRPGDVLLVEGRSHISSIIRSITQSSWTHAALYIGRPSDYEEGSAALNIIREHVKVPDNTQLILEGVLNQGTVIMPLTAYYQHHIRICRPIGITPDDIHRVIDYALRSVGQPYNVRQLLDLARFLLPWTILPRRWRSSLFRTPTGEPDRGICSSLIAEAFSSVQFPILPFIKEDDEKGYEVFQRNPYLYSPKDFDYSPYFSIIKYPLFNPDEPLPYYKRMPWTKTDLIHHDHGVLASHGKQTKKLFEKKEKESKEKKEE